MTDFLDWIKDTTRYPYDVIIDSVDDDVEPIDDAIRWLNANMGHPDGRWTARYGRRDNGHGWSYMKVMFRDPEDAALFQLTCG